MQKTLVIFMVLLALDSLFASKLDENDPNYWLERRDAFYSRTKFNLTDENLRLLGHKRTLSDDVSSFPVGHLPSWFDYALFKKVFNKPKASNPAEELKRQHAYITTCMRVIKLRVLFRMLAGTQDSYITSDADKVSA